jgi:hypothetical protein
VGDERKRLNVGSKRVTKGYTNVYTNKGHMAILAMVEILSAFNPFQNQGIL